MAADEELIRASLEGRGFLVHPLPARPGRRRGEEPRAAFALLRTDPPAEPPPNDFHVFPTALPGFRRALAVLVGPAGARLPAKLRPAGADGWFPSEWQAEALSRVAPGWAPGEPAPRDFVRLALVPVWPSRSQAEAQALAAAAGAQAIVTVRSLLIDLIEQMRRRDPGAGGALETLRLLRDYDLLKGAQMEF